MDRRKYFADTKGTGVLSTADGDGQVKVAVYARPHVMEDGTLGFIMRDRLSHHNLQTNPHAAYLFISKCAPRAPGWISNPGKIAAHGPQSQALP